VDLLPWERVLWSGRSLWQPGLRYILTDFRLISASRGQSDEVVLHDVADVHCRQSRLDRVLATSTVVVQTRLARRHPLVLRHVRRGEQLAALVEILSSDEARTKVDPEGARAALSWRPQTAAVRYAEPLIALAVVAVAVAAMAIGLRGGAAVVTYAADDEIYPGGVKKDREAIVRFMESIVMPWAKQALGPLKGGPANVTCATCHGSDPPALDWRMPAVSALPKPDVSVSGWEVYSSAMDAQMRNAIYGYVAESDNQTKAAYMREVVMPGMARLLHRAPYDFTRPYDFNRTRSAFGCYHCHRVS